MKRVQQHSVETPEKIFFRYDEGAKLFSMGKSAFIKLAHDAEAVYKINQIALVNVKLVNRYMEVYHIYGD